ncbi:nucleotide sugar dehydrogenase [Brevibacillus sp. H7]|uniref:nucleotide sugar dehydrogenase n=1 Tax=Brevibacillus sp. H7 TaxID=3349138 RepID=UPI0037FEB7CF
MTSDGKEKESTRIGVIGLGYVGLPLALLFVKKGYSVVGIEIDKDKVRRLSGEASSYIPDISDEEIKQANDTGRFHVTTDHAEVASLDAIVICVPTPLNPYHTPDLSYLQTVAYALITSLRKDQLVVVESSTYPGTTRELLQPLLEKSGLSVGKDFFLAFSPERIDPGNKDFSIEQITKVVGGVTEECLRRVYDLYSQVFDNVLKVSSPEVAELSKLLENTYRFVNIGLINELALLCDTMKIDLWEVIEAAKTKPYGFQPFYPGPGIGGHCIPVDPLYLQWKAKQFQHRSNFIQLSHQRNQMMPIYVVNKINEHLAENGSLFGSKILIYGVTYKKNINDTRESAALSIIHLLQHKGAEVCYHDPFVPEFKVDGRTLKSVELSDEVLRQMDGVVILTEHSQIPVEKILDHAKFVYDARNATSGYGGKAKVVRLGGGFG